MSAKLRRIGAGALAGGLLLAAQQHASAALTCEQLFAVVKEAVRYRDEGHSLSQVLGALKDVAEKHELNAAEMALLQKSVSAAYLSSAAPEEIALECFNSGALGKPDASGSRRD